MPGKRKSGEATPAAGRARPRPALAMLFILGLALSPWAQEPRPPRQQEPAERAVQPGLARGKKLVLTDGSFHLVRDIEPRGDRVRFYSLERSAWEEIPASLVDWEATARAEKEEVRRHEEARERIRELRAKELAAALDVDASLELAPGVFLPEGFGVFVLEEGQVRPLEQSLAEVRTDKGRVLTQIFVPIPIDARHRIELPGPRAGFRLQTGTPEFYMRTADRREPDIELVRAQVRRNVRRVERVSTPIVGDPTSERESISMQRWQIARGVFRFTPSQTLEPGEYALVELVPGQGTNLYVWDFGVDGPSAAGSRRR